MFLFESLETKIEVLKRHEQKFEVQQSKWTHKMWDPTSIERNIYYKGVETSL